MSKPKQKKPEEVLGDSIEQILSNVQNEIYDKDLRELYCDERLRRAIRGYLTQQRIVYEESLKSGFTRMEGLIIVATVVYNALTVIDENAERDRKFNEGNEKED